MRLLPHHPANAEPVADQSILGAGRPHFGCAPRESDDIRPVWSLAEARRFGDYVVGDRSSGIVCTRCGGCCRCPVYAAESCAV